MLKKLLLIFWSVSVFNAAYALTPPEQTEMVAAHNKWRQEAGVPEVKWSASVAAPAQRWADHLQQEKHCSNKPHAIGNLYWVLVTPFKRNGYTKKRSDDESKHEIYEGNKCMWRRRHA